MPAAPGPIQPAAAELTGCARQASQRESLAGMPPVGLKTCTGTDRPAHPPEAGYGWPAGPAHVLVADGQVGLDVDALLNQRSCAKVLVGDHDARGGLADAGHHVGQAERAGRDRHGSASPASAADCTVAGAAVANAASATGSTDSTRRTIASRGATVGRRARRRCRSWPHHLRRPHRQRSLASRTAPVLVTRHPWPSRSLCYLLI